MDPVVTAAGPWRDTRPTNGPTGPEPPRYALGRPQDPERGLDLEPPPQGSPSRPLWMRAHLQVCPPYAEAGNGGLRVLIGHSPPGAGLQGVAGDLEAPFTPIDRGVFDSRLRAGGVPR